MHTVYKYEVEGTGRCVINIPRNHSILSAKAQGSKLVIYALVDAETPIEQKVIQVVPTGFPITFSIIRHPYLDTVLFDNGAYVLHIFCHKYNG